MYSYSAARKELPHVQITNNGAALIAISPGQVHGAWTFANVPQKLVPRRFSIILRPTASGWTYQYPGRAVASARKNRPMR